MPRRNSCVSTRRPPVAHSPHNNRTTTSSASPCRHWRPYSGEPSLLHCNGRDEALGLPTEAAAQIALRTQQIIATETGVTNTVDPVGGAWAIERLTNDLEDEACALLEQIDQRGGGLAALEQGFIQGQIQESAYRAQKAIDDASTVVVGVNRFTSEESPSVDPWRIDPAVETRQIERLQALRRSRPETPWRQALDNVRQAASGTTNLLPPHHRGRRSACDCRRDRRHASGGLWGVPGIRVKERKAAGYFPSPDSCPASFVASRTFPISDADDARRSRRDISFVGNEQNRVALRV